MKPFVNIITSLITISFINSVYTQNDSLNSRSKVIQQITDTLSVYNTCHYKAQMRFKEMGGDTFEIRNFSIRYKSNTANPLYGYDWEISEEVDSGYTYTIMALPEALYGIFDGSKIIGQNKLPQKIELGSYTEYIRDYLILSEVFSPFASASPRDIVLRDSGNYYYLTRQMNDLATNQLVVSKDNYLPVQFIDTIRDSTFNFDQITEINFYYDAHVRTLPDTAFSIDHYVSLGYAVHHNEESESSEQNEMDSLSTENREFLLNYPFVTETGDITSIRSIKAGYIVLDFWYSSCMPCLKALPVINQLAKDYAASGLVVIGINCFDKGIRAKVATKLRAKNITMPLLFGSGNLIQSLRINSFPSYVLITPDRQVEFIQGDSDDVKKVIDHFFNK